MKGDKGSTVIAWFLDLQSVNTVSLSLPSGAYVSMMPTFQARVPLQPSTARDEWHD